jgi:HEAT repeat protein
MNDKVRAAAVRNLSEKGGEKATTLLEYMLWDTNPYVRLHNKLYDSLLNENFAREDKKFKQDVVNLEMTSSPEIISKMEQLAADADRNKRRLSAIWAGIIGGEKAFTVLEKLLKDSESSVRRIAVSAYGRLRKEDAAEVMAGMFLDEDVWVRRQAALVFGRIGGDAAKTALRQRSVGETDADVKTAVINALERLGNPQP